MSFDSVFQFLGAVDYIFAVPATLSTRDGRVFSFRVTTETSETASRGVPQVGSLPYAVDLRVWSVNRDDLVDSLGDFYKPNVGDVLEINDDEGTPRRYVVTKDDASGSLGRWKHTRPGVRWIFYTRDTETD